MRERRLSVTATTSGVYGTLAGVFDPVAIYAAIVATGVAVLQWRRDRLAVRIDLDIDDDLQLFRVTMANAGQRPVKIDMVCFDVPMWRGNRFRPFAELGDEYPQDTPLPILLTTSEAAVKYFSRDEIAERLACHANLIVVTNTVGKATRKRIPTWLIEDGHWRRTELPGPTSEQTL